MSRTYRRFLILSSPRCGTHLLRLALAEHPEIVALSEVFNADWIEDAPFGEDTPEEEILADHVFCEYPPSVRAVGFALHRAGARFGRWPTLWQRLERDPELHVLSLSRLHLVGRYLSYRLMLDREPRHQPRVITPRELKADLRIQETLVSAFGERFAAHPTLHLKYEELVDGWDRQMRRVQEFLGVEPRSLPQRTRANETLPYRRLIENYDELAQHFAGTRWAWMFVRPPGVAGPGG